MQMRTNSTVLSNSRYDTRIHRVHVWTWVAVPHVQELRPADASDSRPWHPCNSAISGYLEVMRTANQEIVEVASLPVDTQLSDPLCLAAKSLTVVTQRALVRGRTSEPGNEYFQILYC